ncbi:esterase [Ramlibacter sp. PS4R-6]|uniref:esterase n=1 Tax=Ramlibacter sp. PS4R-6 TaxID=3133438 RepID=UPI0030B415B2
MKEPVVVREVPGAQQLILLFHGVGATADDLVPIGEFLARAFPNASVASVPAPFPSDFGSGLQWFSIGGVTEASRPARIEQAMPLFVQAVHELQQRFGVKPEATVIVGFSQGAIMALESARLGHALAGRIVSLSGRFAIVPATPPANTRFHFLHGQDDGVVPVSHAIEAARQLGASATIDVFPATGHGISMPIAQRVVERLRA